MFQLLIILRKSLRYFLAGISQSCDSFITLFTSTFHLFSSYQSSIARMMAAVEFIAVELIKNKSGALAGIRIVINDCIVQAADAVNNRHAAVAHSDQLVQAARLKL